MIGSTIAHYKITAKLGEGGMGEVYRAHDERLNRVFSALADPVRREILGRLKERELLVSEIAEPFDISLQAVSRHIKVLVRAGLVQQQRSGRVSRCRLDAGPIYSAAVWINRYSEYWQNQFDTLALWLGELDKDHDKKRKRK